MSFWASGLDAFRVFAYRLRFQGRAPRRIEAREFGFRVAPPGPPMPRRLQALAWLQEPLLREDATLPRT